MVLEVRAEARLGFDAKAGHPLQGRRREHVLLADDAQPQRRGGFRNGLDLMRERTIEMDERSLLRSEVREAARSDGRVEAAPQVPSEPAGRGRRRRWA